MIISLFTDKLNLSQIQKVQKVASNLNTNYIWLLATMYFETNRTFKTTSTNSIGSVGLIQFTRDKASVDYKTISGKKYLLSDIKKMSFDKQLDLVQLYYLPYKGKLNSFLDVYLVTFFPAAIGQNDSFVLQTKGLSSSLIALQNPVFDTDKNKKITLGEIKKYFSNWYGKQNFDLIQEKTFNYLYLFFIPFFF